MRVRRVGWDEVVDSLEETFLGDKQEIYQEVVAGISSCWIIGGASVITRGEADELVVVCLAGSGVLEVSSVIKQAAIISGYKTVRFHTHRKALGRLLKPLNVKLREYVYSVDL